MNYIQYYSIYSSVVLSGGGALADAKDPILPLLLVVMSTPWIIVLKVPV